MFCRKFLQIDQSASAFCCFTGGFMIEWETEIDKMMRGKTWKTGIHMQSAAERVRRLPASFAAL